MSLQFIDHMNLKQLDEVTIRMMNPLKLAYIGDAVFELYIRTYLVNKVVLTPHEMSKLAIKYVKASSQATMVNGLKEALTEEEWTMVKRGRNQKTPSVPKNALLSDYRYATGFETLIGYLYLMGKEERLIEIISSGIKYVEAKEESQMSDEVVIEDEQNE